MNKKEIKKYITDLHWSKPENIQKQAISQLRGIDEKYIFLLIQPIEKAYWDNAAIVLKEIGFPKYKGIISDLLKWLQDLNWPGALTILDSLKTLDSTTLAPFVEKAILEAVDDRDDCWLLNLQYLCQLADINEKKFLDKEIHEMLNKIQQE